MDPLYYICYRGASDDSERRGLERQDPQGMTLPDDDTLVCGLTVPPH